MDWLAGGLAVGAGVLVAGGSAKMIAPHAIAVALHQVGLPSSLLGGRLLGVVEVSLGAAALVITDSRIGFTVAALYAAFATLLMVLIRRGTETPCGCFGAAGGPPRPGHVAIDLVLGALALWAGAESAPASYDLVAVDRASGLVVLSAAIFVTLLVVWAFTRSKPQRG